MNIQHSTSNIESGMDAVQPPGGKYDLEERLLNYATEIIRLVEEMPSSLAGRHIAGQLLRSGTAPLPNHGEAQAAESTADFIHKLKICLKELRETRRWLRLVHRANLARSMELLKSLLDETDQLTRIFVASIRTAQKSKLQKAAGRAPISKFNVGC